MCSIETVTYPTRLCVFCNERGEVELTRTEFEALQSDLLIQDALPNASLDVREQILSGTHPACWDAMMGPEED